MTSDLAAIFKAYDIRGLSPSQLNPPLARRIGMAFVDYLKAKNIAVGRDMRDTSPGITSAFIEGARSRGADNASPYSRHVLLGPSPLARGRPSVSIHPPRSPGTIPARAGPTSPPAASPST